MKSFVQRGFALLAAALLAACGGGGGSSTSPAVQPNAPAQPTTSATFRIVIPAAQSQARARLPQYVSASTQSVVITLATVNGASYTGTSSAPASIATNLTPSSSACSSAGGTLVCTAPATAVAGSDAFTVTTYDAQQTSTSPATPAGNVLSQGAVTLNVVAGQANTGNLTLNGIASSLAVTFASDPHVSGTQTSGYSIIGNRPYTFTVAALDHDGNTIIGPGAPAFTVGSGSAAVTVATTATAGTYTAQVAAYSSAPVVVTATPSSGSAASFNVTTVQELWVADFGKNAILGFNPLTHAQITTDAMTGLNDPFSLQTGPNGDLWAPIDGNSLVEYVPGNATPVLTITGAATGLASPQGTVFDAGGNVYESNGTTTLVKFAATTFAGLSGSQNIAPAATVGGLDAPKQSAFDGSGNLWVENSANATITELGPSLTPTATISGGNTQLNNPYGLAFDASGTLWIATGLGSNKILAFPTPGTTNGNVAPTVTIAGGNTGLNQPENIAFDAAGNLWVANLSSVNVLEFAAGSLAAGGNIAPVTTLSGSEFDTPIGITFTP